MPPIHQGFPVTAEGDVPDPPLRSAMQVQSICFADFRYFVSQFHSPFFDWMLHGNRLAEQCRSAATPSKVVGMTSAGLTYLRPKKGALAQS
jgi:hypothetical protein